MIRLAGLCFQQGEELRDSANEERFRREDEKRAQNGFQTKP